MHIHTSDLSLSQQFWGTLATQVYLNIFNFCCKILIFFEFFGILTNIYAKYQVNTRFEDIFFFVFFASHQHRINLFVFPCFEIFSESTPGQVPKNGIYLCLARQIFFHIGICHLKFVKDTRRFFIINV